MAKDVLGNIIRIGDKILYQNILCTVKDIQENRVFGAGLTQKGPTSLKIPDTMVLEMEITYNSEQPVNMVAVRTPANNEIEPEHGRKTN